METMNPLFSIAIVTFQQRHLLEDCLYSIFKQTYSNIELIIVTMKVVILMLQT